VGGGAFPDATLPTWLVALATPRCDAVLAALRRHEPPVIARVAEGCVVFDVRTLADEEFAMVEAGVRHAMERP
jgi:L-seryl-tRNA(Ser) seleniumtransferase